MSQIPFIPESAPFTADQRLWLNGYLAGLFSDATLAANAMAGLSAAPASSAAPPKPLVVLYGSQTGTAEGLAKKMKTEASKRGFEPKVVDMAKYDSLDLSKESNVLIVTSTYGDGDPPDNAQGFWNYLSSETAPRLEHVQYSVLALGDTNYPAFCQFGKVCDARLEALGAKRIHPRVDCDVDYDASAKAWTDAVFRTLLSSSNGASPTAALLAPGEASAVAPAAETSPTFSRKNPFPARLVTNRLLNGEGSAKEVRHFEISLEGSGLTYEVGDALGVQPANCPTLVNDLLGVLGCDGEEAVKTPDGAEMSLRLALLQQCDIGKPSMDFLKAAAARTKGGDLPQLIDPARNADLKKFLWGREIIDLLVEMSEKFSAQELVNLLKKLQPRLYSISSSSKAHPGEVHLTIAAVRYESHGRPRKGVCSTFLADRAADAPVPVFVQPAHGFKLPADGAVSVIMVGPGTGIAPFRAFLEERRATNAPGRNWLFFGDQCRATDFLYQETLEDWAADGHLARLDLAFSRDQAEKVYVQQRMLEAGAELWSWLQAGAHFYVCGDASRMAKDVDAALHEVAEKVGGLSTEAAADYIKKLKTDKRYQRDVY
jgi:sulfite reductase (NADPH) flavoprotein alpha-component